MRKQLQFTFDEINKDIVDNEIKEICFRDEIPDIVDTSYLTHSSFYYPAKFIPHVVKYCLLEFSNKNDLIVDPFAGSGTVGLEAYLLERNAYLIDINLLLEHIIPLKITKQKALLDKEKLFEYLNFVLCSDTEFIPNWSNYKYWYPEQFLSVLVKYWGAIKKFDDNLYRRIIQASLIKLSKHFSYAEHRTPKLFRSKKKKKYVDSLLSSNWKEKLDKMFFSRSLKIFNDINNFILTTKNIDNKTFVHGGVDASYYNYPEIEEFDLLISSPPYMQAQEYIRTSKMDLYWLGYSDGDIKKLSRLEIPYRKPDKIFETKTLNEIRNSMHRADLLKILDSYFCFVIQAFEKSMIKLKKGGKACIFIGNPKIDGVEVEIWRILREHFLDKGFKFNSIYEDKIKTRQLFGGRKNKNPDGMKSEFLLVLEKDF